MNTDGTGLPSFGDLLRVVATEGWGSGAGGEAVEVMRRLPPARPAHHLDRLPTGRAPPPLGRHDTQQIAERRQSGNITHAITSATGLSAMSVGLVESPGGAV